MASLRGETRNPADMIVAANSDQTFRASSWTLLRAAPLNVGAWTGRSALSVATTTSRPPLATAGTRKTRVSEVRLSVARTARRVCIDATTRPVITAFERRTPGIR